MKEENNYYEYELVKTIYNLINSIKIENKKEFIFNIFNEVYKFNDIEKENLKNIINFIENEK